MNHHVNNAVYFTYMENARTEVLVDELIHYQDIGIVFIVADASCRYRNPILLTDDVICNVRFELISPLRISVTYLFKNSKSGKLYAEGKTTLVMVNNKINKPVPVPSELVKRLTD